jgi:serine/threonine-protein kinase
MGFRISRDDVFDDEVAKGKVISQTPKGRTEAQEGDLIMLKVSKGKKADDSSSDSSDSSSDSSDTDDED